MKNNKLMFPLGVLKVSVNSQIMVDAKNGSSYHGHLLECDSFMNMKLGQVTITTQNQEFHTAPEVYLRGNQLKSVQLPPDNLKKAEEEQRRKKAEEFAMKGLRKPL